MKQLQLIIIAASLIFTVGCSDDEDQVPQSVKGDILVGTMVMNMSTYEGRGYIQLLDSVKGQEVDNSNGLPIPINYPKYRGEDIFIFPAYVGKADNRLIRYTRNKGELLETGSMPLKSNSSATNIAFASDTKAYLSMAGLGKIWVFNPQTMSKMGEIDLSKLAVGDNNPDPACMLIRDDKLYVGLNQMGASFMPAPDRPWADVAIIDTQKDELLKMITEKTSGLSFPTRPINEHSIFMDEKNDIYVVCIGAFGMFPNHKSGFLRIKSGETEFDKDFMWDVTKENIEGETNKTNLIQTAYYGGNGKLYAYCLIPEYKEADDENLYTAFANIAVEIDLYSKTIKRLKDIPLSNSYSMGIYKYKNEIVFCNYSKNASGLFSYNPQTNQTKQILSNTGFATTFHYFGD